MSTAPRLAVFLGVAGLSAFGIFRAVKYFSLWQHAQRLRRKNSQLQSEEIKSLSSSLNECQSKLEDERKTVASLREEIASLSKRFRDTEAELDAIRMQNQTLVNKSNRLTLQNKHLEGELQSRSTEQKHLKDLLDARAGELKAAQTFLSKADQFAGGDVINLVQQLNAEILQTAANMADQLNVEEKNVDVKGQESDETTFAIARTEEIIGPRLTELLRSSEHHQDPILIQTAFQTGIAAYMHWMISSWCFESPEDEHMLSEIYARVREAGRFSFLLACRSPKLTSIYRGTGRFGSLEATH